jgi:cytochrome c
MKLYRLLTPIMAPALWLACLGATSAHAAGNAERGGDVFDGQCAECHSLKAGKNKKGPSLFAAIGRKSATVPDFVYSDGLKASGITWTPDKIEAYLAAPKTVVPGGKMKFDAKLTPQETADLLAFLATIH